MSREKGFHHSEETKIKIGEANKKRKGMKFIHTKIKNLDFGLIKELIKKGKSSVDIAKVLEVSYPTILKYTKIKFGEELYIKLKRNGIKKKGESNFKDGRGITRRFKHDKCQKCSSILNLEIHHINPAIYNKNCQMKEGNHNPDNLITLCNSCHQKVHYRELGRKHKVKHNSINGRFIHNV